MTGGRRRAFSLVELLVVLGLVGLLMSLTLSAIQHARAAANKLGCQNNLRQIGLAMHHWQAGRQRLVPAHAPFMPIPGTEGAFPPLVKAPSTPEGLLSWMALLLPEIDQGPLYAASRQACLQNKNPLVNPPHVGHATVIPLYTCPADSRLRSVLTDALGKQAAYTSYVGLSGVWQPGQRRISPGVFAMRRPATDLIRDGASNTVMLGERPPPDPPLAGWWYPRALIDGCHGPNTTMYLGLKPVLDCDNCIVDSRFLGPGRLDNPCDRYHLWSLHSGGANFLFADGSVRFLFHSANSTLPALITVGGAEPVASSGD